MYFFSGRIKSNQGRNYSVLMPKSGIFYAYKLRFVMVIRKRRKVREWVGLIINNVLTSSLHIWLCRF